MIVACDELGQFATGEVPCSFRVVVKLATDPPRTVRGDWVRCRRLIAAGAETADACAATVAP